MTSRPVIQINEEFSLTLGQESFMINYKASAGDVLHSIEIHTSDYDKFLEVAAKIKEFMQGRIVSQDMGD